MSTTTRAIRRLTTADLTSADYERFAEQIFGDGALPRHARYCRWLYAENPTADPKRPLSIFAVFEANRPVAQLGVIPCTVVNEQIRLTAGWCVDFFVLASHQRQGLGQQLLEAAEIDFPALLTLGQTEASRKLFLKNNWRPVGELTHYKYALRLMAFAARKLRKHKAAPPPDVDTDVAYAFAARLVAGVEVTPLLSTHALATALESITPHLPAAPRIERSAAFLNWRYLEHPFQTYRVARLRSPDAVALAVWTTTATSDGVRGEIVDCLYPADVADAALRRLTDAVIHCLREEHADLLTCRTSDPRLLRALPPSIFSTRAPGPQFLHAPCGDLESKLPWHLNAGDCDVDLITTRHTAP